MHYTFHESPIGALLLAGSGAALELVGFPTGSMARQPHAEWRRDDHAFAEARKQLSAYFSGQLKQFELELAPSGTAFQLQVWQALQAIPYGETCSYRDIAERIDRPRAVRAVGHANGRNPLPVIVPCHRVIGSNGALTGFGGGLPTKTFLLNLEGARRAA